MTSRRLLTSAGLAAALALLAGEVAHLLDDPSVLRPVDYMEYWSAGRATLRGDNPYDGTVLYPLQQECGTRYDDPIMMWNPPWTLPAAMAVGAVPWRAGQLAWFAANLTAVVASVLLLWRLYGGPGRLAWVPVAVALGFAPVAFLLLLGQISGFLLLGVAGFLAAVRAERFSLAGALAALTAVKPHLFVLFALALAFESLRDRRMLRAVVVGGLVLAVLGAVPLLWNPDVWRQYHEATSASAAAGHNTLAEWRHPTLGYVLRTALPGEPVNAQYMPCAIVALAFPAYWWARRRGWDWSVETPRLVAVSVLAAPYGAWAFDLVVLLVPLTQAVAALAVSRPGRAVVAALAAGFVAVNAIALLMLLWPESQANLWLAPVTVAGCLLAARIARPIPA